MKNIHILPTSQPSIIFKSFLTNRLGFEPLRNLYRTGRLQNQNIYITNDVDIKEGDWVFNIVQKTILKASKQLIDLINDPNVTLPTNKKIIITTDPDLIKDGVQEIEYDDDDDIKFLEWLIKNPTCDFIETILWISDEDDIDEYYDSPDEYPSYYEIIIPKEELVNPNNQEVMFHEEHKEYFYEDFVNGKLVTVWLGKDYIPKEEPIRKIDTCYNFDMEIGCVQDICRCEKEEPKQETPLEEHYLSIPKPLVDVSRMKVDNHPDIDNKETLEEAAERLYPTTIDSFTDNGLDLSESERLIFTNGAKWQQEQDKNKYSYKEVLTILHNYRNHFELYRNLQVLPNMFFEWFEQFKKK